MSKRTVVLASLVSAFLISGSIPMAFADESNINIPEKIASVESQSTSMHTEEATTQKKPRKKVKRHARKYKHQHTRDTAYSTEKRIKSNRR